MSWTVDMRDSVVADLSWFGKAKGRELLKQAISLLASDPLAESKNIKTLRPNPIAQREVRLHGKYRILFDVNKDEETVTLIVAGEKLGNRLMVQGKEFFAHHEDHNT